MKKKTIEKDTVILDQIPFSPDLPILMKRLAIPENSRYANDFSKLSKISMDVARPKAMVMMLGLEEINEDSILAGGILFKSRVLAVNLKNQARLFAFAATCGTELEEWSSSLKSLLHKFWMETLKQTALAFASKALKHSIMEDYNPGRTTEMCPGELEEDWPLSEQAPLFALLGDTEQAIGLSLLPSLMMKPEKTRSGVIYATEDHFETCMLCPQGRCPGRRAPFEENLYERKYR
ncbi:MAG: hypothetical protein KKF30_03575 [Proteobacteria bacterium]|nr:hypothetical protein [Pseudomonadota bacterium]MBU4470136.1 hypothetical protein [Pseudomonadota bacterium]MCG2753119.1 hypothetical protein [Desulfobacteraceae bacterium]